MPRDLCPLVRAATIATILLANPAIAQDFASDTYGSSSMVMAVQWIQGTLLGTVATISATIAIAWLGLLMLRGHLPIRRAGTVLLGCFILFGAGAIAQGLLSIVDGGSPSVARVNLSVPPVAAAPTPLDDNADPYADGAVSRP